MHDLVELIQVSPRILLDIRYATPHNFTGRAVYPTARCFLLRKTAERLHRVQLALEKQGLGLKVFDGYRPHSVQKIFWDLMPNSQYVADPAVGSKHNRGTAVDLTLANQMMPTDFDDFSEKAAHSYQGASPEALKNRAALLAAMTAEGFIPYEKEWWHYDDPEWELHPILDVQF